MSIRYQVTIHSLTTLEAAPDIAPLETLELRLFVDRLDEIAVKLAALYPPAKREHRRKVVTT